MADIIGVIMGLLVMLLIMTFSCMIFIPLFEIFRAQKRLEQATRKNEPKGEASGGAFIDLSKKPREIAASPKVTAHVDHETGELDFTSDSPTVRITRKVSTTNSAGHVSYTATIEDVPVGYGTSDETNNAPYPTVMPDPPRIPIPRNVSLSSPKKRVIDERKKDA